MLLLFIQSFSWPDYSVSSYRDLWWCFMMWSFTNGAILLELNVTLNDDITTKVLPSRYGGNNSTFYRKKRFCK